MKELTLAATLENLEPVQAFAEENLEALGCSMKAVMQTSIVVEEIYVNIAHYAYAPATGDATLRLWAEEGQVWLQFIDEGQPFDPLARAEVDTDLSAEERQVGGLGIHMIKKMMDHVEYQRTDGKNVLTVMKRL